MGVGVVNRGHAGSIGGLLGSGGCAHIGLPYSGAILEDLNGHVPLHTVEIAPDQLAAGRGDVVEGGGTAGVAIRSARIIALAFHGFSSYVDPEGFHPPLAVGDHGVEGIRRFVGVSVFPEHPFEVGARFHHLVAARLDQPVLGDVSIVVGGDADEVFEGVVLEVILYIRRIEIGSGGGKAEGGVTCIGEHSSVEVGLSDEDVSAGAELVEIEDDRAEAGIAEREIPGLGFNTEFRIDWWPAKSPRGEAAGRRNGRNRIVGEHLGVGGHLGMAVDTLTIPIAIVDPKILVNPSV